MDKVSLFEFLSTQDAPTLLELLRRAHDQMNYDQREAVFGSLMRPAALAPVEAEALLAEVEAFQRVSMAGTYYAPFNVNSKNFRHVPDQTKEWFDKLSDLLTASVQLTAQGDHLHAASCFKILYALIGAMEEGQEIVFGDEEQFIAAYMTSLAAIATPEEFAVASLPLIRRDSWQSFTTQAYTAAIIAATDAQRDYLEMEIRQRKLRTGPMS